VFYNARREQAFIGAAVPNEATFPSGANSMLNKFYEECGNIFGTISTGIQITTMD
jgi:vacuolar-type H+-ATPase subunit B/Vma2